MAAENNWVGPAIIVGGLLMLADKVLGDGKDETPGGDVDPNGGDDRPATLSDVDATTIADGIFVAVWGDGLFESITEDEAAVVALMELAQVTNDVRLIYNAYGLRGTVTSKLTLPETLAAYLERSDLDAINADYQVKGITIRF